MCKYIGWYSKVELHRYYHMSKGDWPALGGNPLTLLAQSALQAGTMICSTTMAQECNKYHLSMLKDLLSIITSKGWIASTCESRRYKYGDNIRLARPNRLGLGAALVCSTHIRRQGLKLERMEKTYVWCIPYLHSFIKWRSCKNGWVWLKPYICNEKRMPFWSFNKIKSFHIPNQNLPEDYEISDKLVKKTTRTD